MTDTAAVGRTIGENQQQQQQQQQQSESPPPQSDVVVSDNDYSSKQEEGATGFGANFRKSWQNLRRRQSAISSSASSISGVAKEELQQDNRDDGEEGNKNGIVDLLNEVDDTNGKSILLRRADQISISYYLRASKKEGDDTTPPPPSVDANIILSGLILKSAVDRGGAPIIDGINENGLLTQHSNSCTLLDGSLQSATFFNVGDVIEYACGVDCCRWGEPNNIMNDEIVDAASATSSSAAANNDELSGEDEATDGIKEVETVAQINDISVHDRIETMRSATRSSDATVRVSTTKSVNNPIRICQSVILFSKKEIMDEIAEIQMNNLKQGGGGEGGGDESISFMDVGITFSQCNGRLTIGDISKSEGSWFSSSGCAIRKGDVIVAINEFLVSKMSPQDVTSLIHDMLSSPKTCHLSITTIATSRLAKSSRWGKIRKAAVTAGGGVLVGSGALLMATPLHPVGHAMAFGGVGLLSTEYDTPMVKAMNAAKGAKERLSETRQSWNERRILRKSSTASAQSNSSNTVAHDDDGNNEVCTEELNVTTV